MQTGLIIYVRMPQSYKEKRSGIVSQVAGIIARFLGVAQQFEQIEKELMLLSGIAFSPVCCVQKPVELADDEVLLWLYYPVKFKVSDAVSLSEQKALCRVFIDSLLTIPEVLGASFIEAEVRKA